MGKTRKPKSFPTVAAIATAYGVSETTVYGTKRKFPDFPAPRADGYRKSEVDAFLRRHRLWAYREKSGSESSREARLRLVIEKTANLRITNERLRAKQAEELEDILLASDVRADVAVMRDTMLSVAREAVAKLAALFERQPTEEGWPAQRAAIMAVAESVPPKIGDAMQRAFDG